MDPLDAFSVNSDALAGTLSAHTELNIDTKKQEVS